jgi:CBS domain-containing protein
MKLTDIMQRNVEVISGDTSVREAARKMEASGIGALPVAQEGKIVGMLTDRDVVVRSVARGDDPDRTRAMDAMTPDLAWCYDDDSIETVSRKMSECQIQRLVILDHDEKLVGIVSLGDLARARGNAPAVTHALEGIKSPTKPSAVGADARQLGH